MDLTQFVLPNCPAASAGGNASSDTLLACAKLSAKRMMAASALAAIESNETAEELIYEEYMRTWEDSVNPTIMLVLGAVGMLVNTWAVHHLGKQRRRHRTKFVTLMIVSVMENKIFVILQCPWCKQEWK